GNVFFVRLSTGYNKRRVIASPHYEHWRLMITEPLLPDWIGLQVILIVVKEVELNIRLTGLIQKVIFIGPSVRIDSFRMRRSADVAIQSGFKRKKILSKCGFMGGPAVPKSTPRRPQGREPFLVRNCVLNDERFDLFRPIHGHSHANRTAIVVKEESVMVQIE